MKRHFERLHGEFDQLTDHPRAPARAPAAPARGAPPAASDPRRPEFTGELPDDAVAPALRVIDRGSLPPTGSDRAAIRGKTSARHVAASSSTSRTGSTTTRRRPARGHVHRQRAGRGDQHVACARGSTTACGCAARSRAGTRAGPHAYFTLADDQPADAKAVIQVAFFAPQRERLRPLLERIASRLGDGMKVRIYGYLDFYAPTGQLTLKMAGIDPRFTLGDLAQQRDQVLRRLVAGGLVDATGAAAEPGRRCASASSPASAAPRGTTSSNELRRSGARLPARRCATCACRATAPSPMVAAAIDLAGRAVRSTPSSSSAAAGPATSWPCSTPSRSPWPSPPSPVPVLTGLGHEIDRSVADEVAHTSFKTPTACAQCARRRLTATYLGRRRAGLRARPSPRPATDIERAPSSARRPRPPHRPAHPRRRRPCRRGSRPAASTGCAAARRPLGDADAPRRRGVVASCGCGRRRCSPPSSGTSTRSHARARAARPGGDARPRVDDHPARRRRRRALARRRRPPATSSTPSSPTARSRSTVDGRTSRIPMPDRSATTRTRRPLGYAERSAELEQHPRRAGGAATSTSTSSPTASPGPPS